MNFATKFDLKDWGLGEEEEPSRHISDIPYMVSLEIKETIKLFELRKAQLLLPNRQKKSMFNPETCRDSSDDH